MKKFIQREKATSDELVSLEVTQISTVIDLEMMTDHQV